jgi:hypothetical protein
MKTITQDQMYEEINEAEKMLGFILSAKSIADQLGKEEASGLMRHCVWRWRV